MPRIIQDNKQETALSEIVSTLESIRAYNAMLKTGKEGQFSLVMAPAKGRQTKVNIPASEVEALLGLCEKTRAKLVKNVDAKAMRFRIALDDEDRKCMEPLSVSFVSKPSKPSKRSKPSEPEETEAPGEPEEPGESTPASLEEAEEGEESSPQNTSYPDLEADDEEEDIPLMPPS